MNVPNLIFDPEGSARPPATSAYGSRSIANEPYGASVNFNAQEAEPTSDLRKMFFMYLGLALRYRWLIAVCCALSLAVGFFLTYSQTPIYQATVTVQIDRQAPKVVKVGDSSQDSVEGDEDRFYETQYDL